MTVLSPLVLADNAMSQPSGTEASVEMPLPGKPFEFSADLSAYSLGAIMPAIASQRKLNYVVTPAAKKLLKKRWEVSLAGLAEPKPEGPQKVGWAQVRQQLEDAEVDVHLFTMGGQTTLELSSSKEILLVVKTKGDLPLRADMKGVPQGVSAHVLDRANVVVLEGPPSALRQVRQKLGTPKAADWEGYAAVRPDNAGKYVLTYRLYHAWAQDGMQMKALVDKSTLPSKPRGIVNALSSVIQDYVGAPRLVGVPELVAADAGRAGDMVRSFQAANIPGFESEQAMRQMVGGLVEPGQKVRLETVPLRTETDVDTLARPLAPLGATTITLLPSGAIVESPAGMPASAQNRRDAIEQQYGSRLLALPMAAPVSAETWEKGVTAGPDPTADRNDQVPSLVTWSVHADHANNSLIVVTPPIDERAAVLDFLRYLETMVGILDEPVSMVEITAAIVDIDTNRLEEWGPRFAVATGGKLGGWPTFTRSGFDASQGQPSTFNNILDPGVGGLSKITAETVAGEGLNVGALLVGSSLKLLATFRALEADGAGHVLARPAVVTLDCTEAEMTAKTSLFIPSVGLTTSSLSQVEVPMSIRVLPQVIETEPGELAVSMRILVEDGLLPANAGAIVINYSRLVTSAIVPSGESVLLAGRRRHQEFDRKRRVPLLSRVPGVGRMFQNSSVSDQSQQRMILITPRIVKPLTQEQRMNDRLARDGKISPNMTAGGQETTPAASTSPQPGLLPPVRGAEAAPASVRDADAVDGSSEQSRPPSSTPSLRVRRRPSAEP